MAQRALRRTYLAQLLLPKVLQRPALVGQAAQAAALHALAIPQDKALRAAWR